jgi:hypothetical protein
MNTHIMKQLLNKFLPILILSSLGFSCSITVPRAINENPIGNTTGKATQTTYFGIFSVGDDASIEQAARNGNLKTISTVDYQITNLLGIVTTQSVIVTGSQTLEEPTVSTNQETTTTLASTNESEKKDIIASSTENSTTNTKKDLPVGASQNSTTPGNIVSEGKKEIVEKNKTIKPIEAPANTFVEPNVKPQNEVIASKNSISSKETKRIEIANEEVSPENKDTNKRIEGFSIKAKSLSDFSKKIKETSSEYMQFGDLTPIDIKLNLTTLTFSCNFIQKTSGLIKLGLFYGPKSLGCESCESVIINNPGSKVLAKSSNAIFVSQLIGVYSK